MARWPQTETDPAYVAGGATDAELAAAVATVNTALAAKQESSTAATDAELASAVAALEALLADKQDSATAASDAEVTAAIAAHAAGDATDAELAAAVATLEASMATDAELAASSAALDVRLDPLEAGRAFADILVLGHSYAAANTGLSRRERGYAYKLAAILRARLQNRGALGASLTAAGNTGWVNILQGLVRDVAAAPYSAAEPLAIVDFGINDLNVLKDTYSSRWSIYIEVMRAVISRVRQASVKENTDASVAYSGTDWTETAGTTNSGVSTRTTTTSGAVATITVPSDFEGGTVAIGVQDTTDDGAVYTVREGATVLATLDSRPIVNGVAAALIVPHVIRVEGLAAGAHTLTLTVTSIDSGGTVAFDYWAIEAPVPPIVLVHNIARMRTYANYGTPAPDDADVAAVNLLLDALVDEFDEWVVLVDADAALGKDDAKFAADDNHPNDAGHDALAAADLAALGSFTLTPERIRQLAASREWAVPTIPSRAALHLPAGADTVKISGTTAITNVFPAQQAGRRITLIFTDALTFTDGGNLKIAGNFTTTADDVIDLVTDGALWHQISRAAN